MMCRLFFREIRHRWGTFLLSVLSVAVAGTALIASRMVIASHDARTKEILDGTAKEQKEKLAYMGDQMRRAMLKLSFNCVVLPAGQDLAEWHRQDFGSKTMPETYAEKLADSGIITVRHFLPSLQRRTLWPEQRRQILLVGSRGEVPNLHKGPKTPMVQPVPEGSIVLGHELHTSLGLMVGDKVTLKGRQFTVSTCHEQRGNKDDITAWIPLHDAQELLEQPGRINAILALECLCAGEDALPRIRKEITDILPDTQVVEVGSRVIARAEARYKLSAAIKETVAKEKATREALRQKRQERADLITTIVLVVSVLWLAVLTTVNASQRRDENAVLRTFGMSGTKLLALVLGRSLFTALLGALGGIALGGVVGRAFSRLLDGATVAVPAPSAQATWVALGATLGLAVLAAWLPALAAVLRDPADELRER